APASKRSRSLQPSQRPKNARLIPPLMPLQLEALSPPQALTSTPLNLPESTKNQLPAALLKSDSTVLRSLRLGLLVGLRAPPRPTPRRTFMSCSSGLDRSLGQSQRLVRKSRRPSNNFFLFYIS